MQKKIILSEEQKTASEPTLNVVVQANAGTGKTFVLVQRLLRALFREYKEGDKAKPNGILCLTYTNAGAAEMRGRILSDIMKWATADDSELRELLNGIAHNAPATNDDLKIARKIFYNLIDNPYVIKIQTIHSFCEDILRRFSVEAKVPASWRIVSGAEQKRLLKETFRELMMTTSGDVSSAFDNILGLTSEYLLDELLDLILDQYRYILEAKINSKTLAYLVERTRNFLDIDKVLQKPENYEKKLSYLTKEGEIRRLKSEMQKDAEEIYEYDQFEKNKQIFQTSKDFLTLCNSFADKYIELKNKRGLLDFDDVLYKTAKLFSDQNTMGQVLSQLDFTLKHIFVDEAQDTSPIMWDIIFSMLDNFFVKGEIQNPRSVFIVGDIKQSIFSFQGANPETFEKIPSYIEGISKNNKRQCQTVPLTESRRTTQTVLDVVDFFFNNADLANFPKNIHHKCWRTGEFGQAEIHPEFEKISDEKLETTKKRYIKVIANKIESLIRDDKVSENDIMVLVQRRHPFSDMLARELKKKNIQISGIDKIILPEFPAIRDLLNLIRFATNPNDDASLAFVLRSPICRWSEIELYNLCANRDRTKPLFSGLLLKNPETHEKLSQIVAIAHLPPFSFFSEIMNCYRKEIIASLGRQVIEPLDEFMTLCLSFERTKSGGLIGFLRWFLDGENEIKRDMEKGSGIRIITAHSSKGLEAPIVFLIDTLRNPKSQTKQKPFTVLKPKPDVFLCKHGSISTEQFESAKEIDLMTRTQEYWRLLYVAMTRARDRLYIFGCPEKNKNESWHSKIYETIKKMPGITMSKEGIISILNVAKSPLDIISVTSDKQLKEQDYTNILPKEMITPKKDDNLIEIKDFLKTYNNKHAFKNGADVHQQLEFLDINSKNELAVKIRQNSGIAKFWSSGSRAEVPIAGTINGVFYSLRIDRTAEDSNEILFIDYKTDLDKSFASEYYEKLKKYALILGNIYPEKKIRAHILWLNNLELEEIK